MWSNVVPREGSPVYPFRSALQCLDDCCGNFLDCYTEFVCLPFQLRRKLCGKQELLALPPQSNFTTEEGHQPHVDGGVSRWPVVRNARVRSGPHLSSQEIGMLKPGDYVQILEEVTRDGHQRIRIREGASSFFGDDAWVSRLTDKGTVLVEAPPGGVAAAAAAPAVQQLSDELREVPGAEESPEVARKSMIYIQDMRSCYLLNAALCGCIFLLAWVVLLLVWAKQNQWRMTPVGSILPATRGMTTYGQRDLGEFREPQTISVTHKNFNGQGSDNTVIYCTSGLGLPNADWPCESTNNMYNDASRFTMRTNGAYACIFCTEGLYCSEYSRALYACMAIYQNVFLSRMFAISASWRCTVPLHAWQVRSWSSTTRSMRLSRPSTRLRRKDRCAGRPSEYTHIPMETAFPSVFLDVCPDECWFVDRVVTGEPPRHNQGSQRQYVILDPISVDHSGPQIPAARRCAGSALRRRC